MVANEWVRRFPRRMLWDRSLPGGSERGGETVLPCSAVSVDVVRRCVAAWNIAQTSYCMRNQ